MMCHIFSIALYVVKKMDALLRYALMAIVTF